jgi:hypothetical protein
MTEENNSEIVPVLRITRPKNERIDRVSVRLCLER